MAGARFGIKLPRWRELSTSAIVGWASVVLIVLAASAHATWPGQISVWAIGVPTLALAVVLMTRQGLPWHTIAAIAGALALYASYMTYTGYGERNFDGGEQLAYVRYIAEHWSLPSADECFVCHHPPAYYALAAVVYRGCEITKLCHPHHGVQLWSMLTTFAFVLFGTKLVMRFTDKRWFVTLSAALMAYWPYTIMNTTRLHNDPQVIALMTAGLYFLVCWHQDERPRDIWLASVLALASLLTKTNGYILVASIALVVFYRVVIGPERKWILAKTVPPIVAIAIAAAAFTLMRGAGDEVDTRERVLGTASKIGTHEWVDNEPANYLYFDLESFLTEPYVLTRRDGTGRQYYWNHLLKSSLFASHNDKPDAETTYRWNWRIAELMNFLLLVMLGIGAVSLLTAKHRGLFHRFAVPLISSACFFGIHIAFRAMIPAAHHTDFRMVHPLLVFFALGYGLATERWLAARVVLGRVALAVAMLFMTLSTLYYIPKYRFVRHYLPARIIREPESKFRPVVPERTLWESERCYTLRGDEILEIAVAPQRNVAHIEATLDHNDVYSFEIFGATETRTVKVGPRLPPEPTKDSEGNVVEAPSFKGLAQFELWVDPPVEKVRVIRVRAVKGDMAYGVGHITINTLAPPPLD